MSPDMFDQDAEPNANRIGGGLWLQSSARLAEYQVQVLSGATNPAHAWLGGSLTFQPDHAYAGLENSVVAKFEPEADAAPDASEEATEAQPLVSVATATTEELMASTPSWPLYFWDGLILSTQADAVYVRPEVALSLPEDVVDQVIATGDTPDAPDFVVDDVVVSDDSDAEIEADYAMAASFDDTPAPVTDDGPLSTNFDLVRWSPSFETLFA